MLMALFYTTNTKGQLIGNVAQQSMVITQLNCLPNPKELNTDVIPLVCSNSFNSLLLCAHVITTKNGDAQLIVNNQDWTPIPGGSTFPFFTIGSLISQQDIILNSIAPTSYGNRGIINHADVEFISTSFNTAKLAVVFDYEYYDITHTKRNVCLIYDFDVNYTPNPNNNFSLTLGSSFASNHFLTNTNLYSYYPSIDAITVNQWTPSTITNNNFAVSYTYDDPTIKNIFYQSFTISNTGNVTNYGATNASSINNIDYGTSDISISNINGGINTNVVYVDKTNSNIILNQFDNSNTKIFTATENLQGFISVSNPGTVHPKVSSPIISYNPTNSEFAFTYADEDHAETSPSIYYHTFDQYFASNPAYSNGILNATNTNMTFANIQGNVLFHNYPCIKWSNCNDAFYAWSMEYSTNYNTGQIHSQYISIGSKLPYLLQDNTTNYLLEDNMNLSYAGHSHLDPVSTSLSSCDFNNNGNVCSFLSYCSPDKPFIYYRPYDGQCVNNGFYRIKNPTNEIISFEIYPNPTTDLLNINVTENVGTIQILNMIGNVVYEKNINTNKNEINTSNYSNGIYCINYINNGKKLTKTFLIQH